MTSSMQILSTKLAQVLSEQDVAAITQAVDRSVVDDPMTDDRLLRFARAIESAVLTTLARQPPVATAWLQHGTVVELFPYPPTDDLEQCTNADPHWRGKGFVQTPLYTTPQPDRQAEALRVALEEMEYANQLSLGNLGVELINPKKIAPLRAVLQ